MPTSEKFAQLLIEAINNTGGLVQFSDGTVAPACDPDWVDLGEAYLSGCAETGQEPQFVQEGEPVPFSTDTLYQVTRG